MIRFVSLVAGASAALPLLGVPETGPKAMTHYKWTNRPLLVFAPSASHGKLARQRAIVQRNRSGFRERDMVVAIIAGDSVRMMLGAPPRLRAGALRKRYGVEPGGFRVVLVGKDGGKKLVSSAPVSAGQLFRLIDSMPMRQQEMRRRRQ